MSVAVASRASLPAAEASEVELRAVTKRFGATVAVRGVDLQAARGSRVGILGPSGSGKSTVLQIVAGLLEADAGTVMVAGSTTPSDRLARCAFMPQRDLLLPWRTALDNASIALQNKGYSRKEARDLTRPYFDRFGLSKFEGVLPSALSGGMRQRVAFIRTLMAQKDVLLLDEPFGALDSITRGEMQAWLLLALAHEPRTVLLVTHDVEEALLLSETVVVMSARPGRVVRIVRAGFPSDVPRREIVTSPEFVDAKELALEAIE